jgi:hypothetical protein
MKPELDQFFADLSNRHGRLLQLVQPTEDTSALVDELTELGEQLIIAEEELRVQQEELTAASARMQTLVNEREELRSTAAEPYVLTDSRGLVLRTNPAADQLIRRPAARATPRPIATWFQVADRSAIRTVISRLTSGEQNRAETRAVLTRSDRTTLAVHVTVTANQGGSPGQPELLWRLEAEPLLESTVNASQPVSLQLVATPSVDPADLELAAGLTRMGVELAGCRTEQHLMSTAVEAARRLIPHAEHVGVLLCRRGKLDGAASAGGLATEGLQRELDLQEGPSLTALKEPGPVLVVDTWSEFRWAAFAAVAAECGIRSMLSVEVAAGETVLGALSVYAEQPDAFDEEAAFTASLLATQVGLALSHLRTVTNLRAGMDSRAEVGEAIGVLKERHRITSQDAFQLLVRASQRNNVKLHGIAQIVSETGQDPAELVPR